MKSRENKQFQTINLGSFLGFLMVLFGMYFLLLGPEHTFLSLYHILKWSEKLHSGERLIVLSFIPIYLAILIFGGALLGWKMGEKLNRFFVFDRNNNKN